ncbi:tail assembly protein [Xanthomonas phage FMYAK-P1]|uniref:Tail assembly protein n=1 Tax=Xanthomonas phage FMYAK-P1 TaxID=2886031 RepID=A0AAE9C9L1_9CAUD|nr:tail assembly protein [Xanthomonas phage FMYAK-P1]UGL62753.1 tail assembly protein [Xanthomonas phage FMYAK-P1]UGL62824.1 tail assembly protein [Xanthomonas phage MET13-T1]
MDEYQPPQALSVPFLFDGTYDPPQALSLGFVFGTDGGGGTTDPLPSNFMILLTI